MHLDDLATPGPRVQRVDVLRHDRLNQSTSLQLGEREMASVRLRRQERVDARAIEAPDALRVAPEGLDRRDFEGIDLGPDTGRGAEVGNAALGRDARSGEHDARLPLDDESG